MRTKWLIFALSVPALGQSLLLQVDAAASRVGYTLGAVGHTVHGTFRVKSGEIRIDTVNHSATGSVIADAASGDSGNSGRDSRMNKSVLESDRFPEISFKPDHLSGKLNPEGPSDIELHGTFTIHGTPHELTAPVHVEFAGGRFNATVRFPVPYVKWGMKNPSTLFL